IVQVAAKPNHIYKGLLAHLVSANDNGIPTWHPTVEIRALQLLKFYPLAFMFAQEPWFAGFPNMRSFLRPRDDEEVEVPVDVGRRIDHPLWPATATPNSLIMLGGDSFGLIAAPRIKRIDPV